MCARDAVITVVVTGWRKLNNAACVHAALEEVEREIPPGTLKVLVHGGCLGLDKQAAAVAHERKWNTVIQVDAEWRKYGEKPAGPIRNQAMLNRHKPQYVLAFHPEPPDRCPAHSGTRDCYMRAKRRFTFAGPESGLVLRWYTGERVCM